MTDLTLYRDYVGLPVAHRIAFLEKIHRSHWVENLYAAMSEEERKEMTRLTPREKRSLFPRK